ncbi:MAG: c-type cytochrome, partial [Caulobacteraceae bacterium]|nr:c-type cytochrome [Caulobacteraceae bacterium]
AELFNDRCAMCHGDGAVQGPNLRGVVGRRAGAAPGFAYTPALKGAALIWSPAALDRFLANPSLAIPGTAMPIRITVAAQRADLIAYLASRR